MKNYYLYHDNGIKLNIILLGSDLSNAFKKADSIWYGLSFREQDTCVYFEIQTGIYIDGEYFTEEVIIDYLDFLV